MKRFLLLISVFFNFAFSTAAQQSDKSIYIGIEGGKIKYLAFVEIENNSANVEIMSEDRSGNVHKLYEEKIEKSENTFTPYLSDRIKINADITKIEFVVDGAPMHSADLDPFKDSYQIIDAQRNKAYYYDKTQTDIGVLDSILGKGNYFETDYYSVLEPFRTDQKELELTHRAFKMEMDQIADQNRKAMIEKSLPFIKFLNGYYKKISFTKNDIDEFLKKANFTILGETAILTLIIERSPQTFFAYLDETKFLSSSEKLQNEFKDIAYSKLKKDNYEKIKDVIISSKMESESIDYVKKIFRKSSTKKAFNRSVPLIGFVVLVSLVIKYV